jgi:AcrR family transcriptional regulator
MRSTGRTDRLDELAQAAGTVFMGRGFVRARMSDVAALAEVSQGLLYTYFESKEALILYVAQREIAGEPVPVEDLPIPDPGPLAAMQMIGRALEEAFVMPTLQQAVGTTDHTVDELAEILRELYHSVARWRRLIRMVEMTARDLADVKQKFYARGRRPFVGTLARYLEQGIASGAFRPVPDAAIAARLMIETIAWFANHRHGDLDSADIPDDVAEEMVIDMLVASVRP